jgi:hypothetical protein
MSPYEQIVEYIQDDVHAPHLADEIDSRIKRAVQRYHRMDTWSRDHVDQVYVFAQANTISQQAVVSGSDALYLQSFGSGLQRYIQQIDTRALARPRKYSYIRKWMTQNPWGTAIIDPDTGQIGTSAGGDLTEASPSVLTDGYGYNRNDVYYRSGDYININSSTPLSQVYIGYFSDPVVEPVQNIVDWISFEYPSLIAADVKMRTFAVIGKSDEMKLAQGELQAEIALLQSNNVRVGIS